MAQRVVPLAAVDKPRIDPKAVAFASRRFPPDTLVKVQSDSEGRQWWSFGLLLIPTDNNPETNWQTWFVRPGRIEFEMTIGGWIDDDPEIVVDGRGLEAGITEHLERLAGILSTIVLKGPGLVHIAFRGIEDMVLARARPGGRNIRKPELFLPELEVPDLSVPLHDLLHDQFDILWQAADGPKGLHPMSETTTP